MHAAVRRMAEAKPVVVSMGSVAASGGYYVACGADTIVANPGTITGSIGVKANVANVRKLMDKIGLREETIVSGKFKDAGSPTKPLTSEERAYFQKLVDDLFSQFVEAVAKGRGMKQKEVLEVADGRAFTGQQALELGLVDELGDRAKAVDILREMCDISGRVRFKEGPEQQSRLWSLLLGEIGWSQFREALTGSHALFSY
jgi:protease-4